MKYRVISFIFLLFSGRMWSMTSYYYPHRTQSRKPSKHKFRINFQSNKQDKQFQVFTRSSLEEEKTPYNQLPTLPMAHLSHLLDVVDPEPSATTKSWKDSLPQKFKKLTVTIPEKHAASDLAQYQAIKREQAKAEAPKKTQPTQAPVLTQIVVIQQSRNKNQ